MANQHKYKKRQNKILQNRICSFSLSCGKSFATKQFINCYCWQQRNRFQYLPVICLGNHIIQRVSQYENYEVGAANSMFISSKISCAFSAEVRCVPQNRENLFNVALNAEIFKEWQQLFQDFCCRIAISFDPAIFVSRPQAWRQTTCRTCWQKIRDNFSLTANLQHQIRSWNSSSNLKYRTTGKSSHVSTTTIVKNQQKTFLWLS